MDSSNDHFHAVYMDVNSEVYFWYKKQNVLQNFLNSLGRSKVYRYVTASSSIIP
jgi:hypothetical protein